MQHALLNSDKETGVSVMRMIERLDAGDVLLQKKMALSGEEDIAALKKDLSLLGARTLMESLELIERGTVCDDTAQGTLLVAAGGISCLSLEELQLEGKKMLPCKVFLRGFTLKKGDVLE